MKSTRNKSQIIHDYLKGEINRGTYAEGDLLPTDFQLTEKFQVSRPTVAKAMQRLQEEGLIGRQSGYGTFVKKPSKEKIPKHLNFGLLIPSLGETEIFEPICAQIASLAEEYHFSLSWAGGGTLNERGIKDITQQASNYIKQEVDGIFFAPLEMIPDALEKNKQILEMFRQADIPIVLLDSDITRPPVRSDYDLVGINNIEAGFTLAKHLISKGCHQIGVLTRPFIAGTVHIRLMGAREAVLQAGLPHDSIRVFEVQDSIEEFARTTDFSQIDGLICYNDSAAAPLMAELDKMGIAIPADIKICAFDDVKYAKLLKVPLTTYAQPCQDIGIAAVEAMITRLKRPQNGVRKIFLQGELIVRESTNG